MSGAFQTWLYGKWGPLGRSVLSWLEEAVWPEGVFCCACGRVSGGDALCPDCRKALTDNGFVFAWERTDPEPGLTAWSLRPHAGIHRDLVLRLKYGAEARAARLLGELVLPLPPEVSLPPDTVVTWVTMPESRRRERGIDHGRLLAETVAEKLSLPCRRLLVRRDRRERAQASLGAEQRKANLDYAFSPAEVIRFPVLIVDDVRTTGTTLCRCAAALREGGAEQVFAITVTRAEH